VTTFKVQQIFINGSTYHRHRGFYDKDYYASETRVFRQKDFFKDGNYEIVDDSRYEGPYNWGTSIDSFDLKFVK
jgi:hypothetical protein